MPTTIAENNKRIVKNTIFLYFRMFLIMGITLFTSRVILKTLGVTDFGIYNVVGGVVVMMNILNNALAVSTQRYLTFEQGKNDFVRLKKTFSICMSIFLFLALCVFLLGETIGLWFINSQLTIPSERMVAANWIYQFALFSCICSLFTTPYNAAIIAHEKMNIYAYIGILEVILKLIIVYLLLIIPYDRLITYGILVLLTTLITTLAYRYYCLKNFPETKYKFIWDKTMYYQIASYSGWNLFGAMSGVAKGQGLNILINIFFGPTVNAARGIAYQVNAAVEVFFSNFYMAVRPQITKYYAQHDKENMFKLIFRSSKMAFFLIMILAVPLIIETPFIINLWLGQIPEYVVPFVRIIILNTAIDAMSTPLMTAIHATGNNRLYQILVGSIMIMTLPLSYISLRMGLSPNSVFIISLILSIISLFVRLILTAKQLDFPLWAYTYEVIIKSFFVTILAVIIPLILHVNINSNNIICFASTTATSFISFIIFAYLVGLNNQEREYAKNILLQKLKQIK